VTAGETATVIAGDNGPSAAGSQCIELENSAGDLRLERAMLDLVATYGPLVQFQYDVKLLTNQKNGTPDGVTTFRTRLYDGTLGVAGIGNMHYDGGGEPACQA